MSSRWLRGLTRVIFPRTLKRVVPRSLLTRSLLIIILPIALMQVAVTWAFFDAHWRTVTSHLSDSLAGDIAWVTDAYQRDPSPLAFRDLSAKAEQVFDLSVAFQPGRALPAERRKSLFVAIDTSVDEALGERLRQPYWFDTTRYPAYVDIRVQTRGGVLRFLAPKDRAFASQGGAFVLWLVGATLLLTAVAILFIRNQVRAIERLATAAEAFGRGADEPAFRPHGAREVRQAAQAFLDMKSRIQRHLEQRTALLASVSHDLRTPLTRLKLELAMAAPSPAVKEMKRDLADMEHMIDEYLDFARGEGGEGAEETQVRSLLEEVAGDAARTGGKVAVNADE
ncbi:MAG: histidine kinase dimerization/phospho-acceptor domain-containing protein, partial [Caulobacteraceae bacterium]